MDFNQDYMDFNLTWGENAEGETNAVMAGNEVNQVIEGLTRGTKGSTDR